MGNEHVYFVSSKYDYIEYQSTEEICTAYFIRHTSELSYPNNFEFAELIGE